MTINNQQTENIKRVCQKKEKTKILSFWLFAWLQNFERRFVTDEKVQKMERDNEVEDSSLGGKWYCIIMICERWRAASTLIYWYLPDRDGPGVCQNTWNTMLTQLLMGFWSLFR